MNTVSIAEIRELEPQESTAYMALHEQRRAALKLARAVRDMSLLRRGGKPFTHIAEDLNRLREERDLEL